MYGKTIQLIRKSKGISQIQLAENIMSRSNLSSFENDQYIPSFDKVISLLSKLNIDVEEYLLLTKETDIQLHFFKQELVNVENYGTLDELVTLNRQIAQFKTKSSEYYELYLLSQYLLNIYQLPYEINLEEIKKYIKPLLFENEQWFNHELKLYNNFLFLFDCSENHILYNKVLRKLNTESKYTVSKQYKVHLSINFGLQLLHECKEKEAKKVLEIGKTEAKKEKLFIQELFIHYIFSETLEDIPTLDNWLKKMGNHYIITHGFTKKVQKTPHGR